MGSFLLCQGQRPARKTQKSVPWFKSIQHRMAYQCILAPDHFREQMNYSSEENQLGWGKRTEVFSSANSAAFLLGGRQGLGQGQRYLHIPTPSSETKFCLITEHQDYGLLLPHLCLFCPYCSFSLFPLCFTFIGFLFNSCAVT